MQEAFTYYYIPPTSLNGNEVVFPEDESRHISRVCRKQDQFFIHWQRQPGAGLNLVHRMEQLQVYARRDHRVAPIPHVCSHLGVRDDHFGGSPGDEPAHGT